MQYMSGAYIIDMIIVVVLLTLAVLGLANGGYGRRLTNIFALFALSVAVWVPTNHVSNSLSLDESVVQIANYIVFPTAFLALCSLMLLLAELTRAKHIKRFAYWSLAVLLPICAISPTDLLVESIEKQGSVYAVMFGPLLPLYGLGLGYMTAVVLWACIYGLRTLTGVNHKQFKLIALTLVVCLPIILSLLFILPSLTGIFTFTEYGVSPLALVVLAIFYSIVKYQLFDVKRAAVRSLVYVLTLASLAVIYIIVAHALSRVVFGDIASDFINGIDLINMTLALVLAFLFQGVKRFFDQLTDSIFFHDSYRPEDFYADINKLLSSRMSLRGLLRKVAQRIVLNMKAESVFFFVYTQENSEYLVAGNGHYPRLPASDVVQLEDFFSKTPREIVVRDSIGVDHPLNQVMHVRGLALLLPLYQAKRLVGLVALGEHQSGRYTPKDIRVLQTVAGELVIAIENSLSVLEVEELNATLKHRVADATSALRKSNIQLRHLDEVKDEFLSIASHQLRTPLTSVKGYISLVLDGDAGRINKQQRELLNEAFSSSQRMVNLIEDFLNMSRLQTGRFVIDARESDVVKMITDEVAHLETAAHARRLTLKLEKIGDLPATMRVDENKLRQVIMNFIDNAMYYSHPESDINIFVERQQEYLVFRVVDTGIGVPAVAQQHLFGKFYRAGNARKRRPDGTGVGLYLAKKVVIAHGGEIIFSSKENEGSTFGFKLPIVDTLAKNNTK